MWISVDITELSLRQPGGRLRGSESSREIALGCQRDLSLKPEHFAFYHPEESQTIFLMTSAQWPQRDDPFKKSRSEKLWSFLLYTDCLIDYS